MRVVDGFVIPFQHDGLMNPLVVVQVSINNSLPLPFIVDTGCAMGLLISRWAANELELPVFATSTKLLPGRVKVKKTHIGSIVLKGAGEHDDVKFCLNVAYIADLRALEKRVGGIKIAGLIGVGLLEKTTVRFDFSAKEMTIFGKAHPPINLMGAETLPMKRCAQKYLVGVSPVEGVNLDLRVDTGASLTSLPAELSSRIRSLGRKVSEIRTFGGTHYYDIILLPDLNIGRFYETRVETFVIPGRKLHVLGLNVLSRFDVTMDFRNGLLTLKRPKDYVQRLRLKGWADVYLRRWAGKYYVRKVGSSAEKAGIRTGDCLIEVDGHKIANLSPPVVDRLLNGFAFTQANLLLGRAHGQTVQVAFERQDGFTSP